MKICVACGDKLSLSGFYVHKKQRNGRRTYRGECKACFKAKALRRKLELESLASFVKPEPKQHHHPLLWLEVI